MQEAISESINCLLRTRRHIEKDDSYNQKRIERSNPHLIVRAK